MSTIAQSAIPLTASPYPYAAAPDIIRASQKDAYFTGVLTDHIFDLHRRLLGPRSAHIWSNETSAAADLVYLGLTTLLGNRTLGEEYCGLVQVQDKLPLKGWRLNAKDDGGNGAPRLPSLKRRAAYIASTVLFPYFLSRLLPRLRRRIRHVLEARLTALLRKLRVSKVAGTKKLKITETLQKWEYNIERYILIHLTSLTSGTYFRAATLAIFYFSGAYYTLAKRLTGLRYVFTRRTASTGLDGPSGRAGYEVLGAMLVVQLMIQGFLHVRSTLDVGSRSSHAPNAEVNEEAAALDARIRDRAFGSSLLDNDDDDEKEFGTEPDTIVAAGRRGQTSSIAAMAHTPLPVPSSTSAKVIDEDDLIASPAVARYDLRTGQDVMGWIKGASQRKCTLCLEEMKDPSATQCGHVFCWTCIGDWIREKPECPLCRRDALVQHILPLRVI